jgi:hypothetical protein
MIVLCRTSYAKNLLGISRGVSGTRTMRRLTSRSRFRAAQSLLFANTPTQNLKNQNSQLHDTKSMQCIRNYVFCLAELHELRLPCGESTVAYAIGLHSMADNAPQDKEPISQSGEINPCPLVNTWLRDEGEQSDVCELCRDILLAANWKNTNIWSTLILHMQNKGYVRALLHTMTIIRKQPFFLSLLNDQSIQMITSTTVTNLFSEVCSKVGQVCASLLSFSGSWLI